MPTYIKYSEYRLLNFLGMLNACTTRSVFVIELATNAKCKTFDKLYKIIDTNDRDWILVSVYRRYRTMINKPIIYAAGLCTCNSCFLSNKSFVRWSRSITSFKDLKKYIKKLSLLEILTGDKPYGT